MQVCVMTQPIKAKILSGYPIRQRIDEELSGKVGYRAKPPTSRPNLAIFDFTILLSNGDIYLTQISKREAVPRVDPIFVTLE